jgi:hypothetical protein
MGRKREQGATLRFWPVTELLSRRHGETMGRGAGLSGLRSDASSGNLWRRSTERVLQKTGHKCMARIAQAALLASHNGFAIGHADGVEYCIMRISIALCNCYLVAKVEEPVHFATYRRLGIAFCESRLRSAIYSSLQICSIVVAICNGMPSAKDRASNLVSSSLKLAGTNLAHPTKKRDTHLPTKRRKI